LKILSVNVGEVEMLETKRGLVKSAIRKKPVLNSRRILVKESGLEQDQHADMVFHGGLNSAVYIYPSEHYSSWCELLGRAELPNGFMGENLTTIGIDEHSACIGDQLLIGSTVLVVRSPRLPCFKFLGLTGNPNAATFMLNTGKTGIYLSVLKMGDVGSGDHIKIIYKDPKQISVVSYIRAMMSCNQPELMGPLLAHDELPSDRKSLLKKRVSERYAGDV